MAKGINLVILLGNLGKDPETRETANGKRCTTLTVATTDTWTDKASGQRQEDTEWHRVVLWGNLADIAAKYLRKGRKVYIEGRKKTRSWQSEDGQTHYITEIIAREMQMLGGPGHGDPALPGDGDHD